MCSVCGCGPAHAHDHDHEHLADAHGHGHAHDHVHDHVHGHGHAHDHGHVADEVLPQRRRIALEHDILAENDRLAARNRAFFQEHGITVINVMSAPGSGKTTLLARTIADLRGRVPISVIEGDQRTSFDAERIREAGAAAVQINTGRGCHLDARMVERALPRLDPRPGSLVFVENVGNLVCPAGFDLGENARVVLLSVTEGDDKPLKYDSMFAAASLLLITKLDLLPFVPFDLERAADFARRVNPSVEVLRLSATGGEGLPDWYAWLDRRRGPSRRTRAAASGAE